MVELNAEQIKKALECHANGCKCSQCPMPKRTKEHHSCWTELSQATLSFIKELTEENDAWQKALITEKEKADKAYYDLACEIEDLRAENERLQKAIDTDISIVRVSRGNGRTAHLREIVRIKADAIRADTVRKMREMLCEGRVSNDPVVIAVNVAVKEMLEGKNG